MTRRDAGLVIAVGFLLYALVYIGTVALDAFHPDLPETGGD
jgi:hypothetical protein